jgi:exodeoxyribonuclease V alpha subunit
MSDALPTCEASELSPALRAATKGCEALFSPTELHAVDLAAARWGEDRPDVLLALLLAARAPRVGHAGVSLDRLDASLDGPTELGALAPSDTRAWLARVAASPLVHPHAPRRAGADVAPPPYPFVLQLLGDDDGRHLLLTGQMEATQRRVATLLNARATAPHAAPADLEARVAALFPSDPQGEAATAVRVAASGKLTIVTGGPGTGKTYSIARLLALELTLAPDLRVVLAAPTGKARGRMREALLEQLDHLDAPPAVKASLGALQAETVHRLIGLRPDGTCRHHALNPLPAALVVVDEVSMVDLSLMRLLLEAIPTDARLILLGDRDQLASVEAGTVLADLVTASVGAPQDAPAPRRPQTASPPAPLAGRVVRFTRSRRFESAPDIADVAACLQSGRPERLARAVDLMTGRVHADGERLRGPLLARIRHLGDRLDVLAGPSSQPTLGALIAPYFSRPAPDDPADAGRVIADLPPRPGYAALLEAGLRDGHDALCDPAFHALLLDALDGYRVLGVTRAGPRGVEGLDRVLGGCLRDQLRAAWRRDFTSLMPSEGPHWLGRPILVTRNAPDVRLSNGDVGLILPISVVGEELRLGAVFRAPGAPHGVRAVRLGRLPPHEGGLAMTIHKSQGSQFDRVALVLASHAGVALQTREIVYTGLTRAKARVDWVGSERELREAFGRTVSRASSLAELLGG